MTAPQFGDPNPQQSNPLAGNAPQGQAPAPQGQAPAPQGQAPAPQQNQQAPQGQQFPQQGQQNQAPQGQAPQQNQGGNFAPSNQQETAQQNTFTAVSGHGFLAEAPNVSNYIRLSDHVGKYIILRVKGFGSRTFSQTEGPKETLECDIAVFDSADLNKVEVFTDQGITNGKVVQVGRNLNNQGLDCTVGQIGYGERKGGNNAPIIIQSIDGTSDQGKQIIDYLANYAKHLNWVQQ